MGIGENQLNAFLSLGIPQGPLNMNPTTLVSAATIAPRHIGPTLITGTVQIETITPPIEGTHVLVLVFTNAAPGTFLTSGNVLNAIVPTQNVPTVLIYDPNQKKYYGFATNLT